MQRASERENTTRPKSDSVASPFSENPCSVPEAGGTLYIHQNDREIELYMLVGSKMPAATGLCTIFNQTSKKVYNLTWNFALYVILRVS